MNQTQLDRIRTMERSFTEASAAVAHALSALEQYESSLAQLKALAEYCESPLWLADYDADHAGLLPAGMTRGVLSEDGLYDLLRDNDRLLSTMERLFRLSLRSQDRQGQDCP